MDRALQNYIRSPREPAAHTQVDMLKPRTRGSLDQIVAWLKKECTIEPPSDADLREAINQIAGRDLRTFRKYQQALLNERYLKNPCPNDKMSYLTPGGKARLIPTYRYEWGDRVE